MNKISHISYGHPFKRMFRQMFEESAEYHDIYLEVIFNSIEDAQDS